MTRPKHQLPENDDTAAVPYLPLSGDQVGGQGGVGDESIGSLVRDASQHVSTLVRAEVELAKSELIGEVKKALKGSLFFLVALVVVLYSSFFLFFALAELLADFGLFRSAAFGIVFVLMLAVAGLSGFLGWRKVRKIHAPQRSIDSVKETTAVLRNRSAQHEAEPGEQTAR